MRDPRWENRYGLPAVYASFHRGTSPWPRLLQALLVLGLADRVLASPPSAEPIPWQDAAPVAVPFLQLPMESAAPLGSGQLVLGLRTIYSNSIARVASPQLMVDYQLETAQPSLVLRYGVTDGLELHLELAAVTEQGGFLNPIIRGLESSLGTLNKLRRGPMTREPHFILVRPDGSGTRLTRSTAALGDAWIGAKGEILAGGPGPALSWRAAVKLPTGRFPFGSEVGELGAGLLLAQDLGPNHLWLAADLMVPDGPVSAARLGTRPHPSFQLALGRDLGRSTTVLLQGSVHGPALRYVHLSEIDGWTFYALAGVRVAPTSTFSAGLGVVENLFITERGTDIAAVLDLTWRH